MLVTFTNLLYCMYIIWIYIEREKIFGLDTMLLHQLPIYYLGPNILSYKQQYYQSVRDVNNNAIIAMDFNNKLLYMFPLYDYIQFFTFFFFFAGIVFHFSLYLRVHFTSAKLKIEMTLACSSIFCPCSSAGIDCFLAMKISVLLLSWSSELQQLAAV